MRKVRKGSVRNGSWSALSRVLSVPILLAAVLAGLLVFGSNTLDPIGFTSPDRRNEIVASPNGELDRVPQLGEELVGVPELGERPIPSGSSNLVIMVTDAPIDDFESFYVTFTLVEVLKSSKPVYQEEDVANVEGGEEGVVADPIAGEGEGEAVAEPDPEVGAEVEAEVEVDEGENWMIVMEGSETIDLLALSASEDKPQTTEMLGVTSLDPGKYTQVRIMVESAEGMLNDGAMVPITINEGVFKIVKPFEIIPDSTTYITIDFTLGDGVIKTGQGEYKTIPPRMIGPVIVEYHEDEGDEEPLVGGDGAVGEDVDNPVLVGDVDEKAGKPENPGRPDNAGKPEEPEEPGAPSP